MCLVTKTTRDFHCQNPADDLNISILDDNGREDEMTLWKRSSVNYSQHLETKNKPLEEQRQWRSASKNRCTSDRHIVQRKSGYSKHAYSKSSTSQPSSTSNNYYYIGQGKPGRKKKNIGDKTLAQKIRKIEFHRIILPKLCKAGKETCNAETKVKQNVSWMLSKRGGVLMDGRSDIKTASVASSNRQKHWECRELESWPEDGKHLLEAWIWRLYQCKLKYLQLRTVTDSELQLHSVPNNMVLG